VTKSALEALYARCSIQIDTFTFLPLLPSTPKICPPFSAVMGNVHANFGLSVPSHFQVRSLNICNAIY